jgi:mannose-1-phosphate guanylyltransferase/mannose-6-phosphate isomerase
MSSSQQPPLIPVILAGGSGNRLWPLSRQEYPKQLIALLGERSLIQDTALRYGDRARFGAPLVIANDAIRFTVAEQLQSVGVTPMALVLEPVGRGTAPAVAVAALLAMENDPDAVIIVAPSDHAILDVPALHRAIATAVQAAQAGHLVTFSIPPSRPETGYGYIEHGPALGEAAGAFRVASFVEKPPLARAEAMLAGGTHFWNSGMFAFRAKDFLAELERFQPAIVAAVRAAVAGRGTDLDFVRLAAEPFAASPSDSIDYAVMEKTANAVVVQTDPGWSDVGTWQALWAVSPRDAAGNAAMGDVHLHESSGCYVRAEKRHVAAIGVQDLVIVETDDALLVVPKNRSQDVKEVVSRLDREKRTEHVSHTRVYRPWGYYESIDAGERFQVKRIMVKPQAALSLQMHHHRAEHWVVVSGTAKVTCGEKQFLVAENESTYIPVGTKHRLENPGKMPLHLIEVQSGGYLGEDDIVRFEDRYQRP